jgi:hypothetical protein
MSLNRNLHIGLILVVIVTSIDYGIGLDWESILYQIKFIMSYK